MDIITKVIENSKEYTFDRAKLWVTLTYCSAFTMFFAYHAMQVIGTTTPAFEKFIVAVMTVAIPMTLCASALMIGFVIRVLFDTIKEELKKRGYNKNTNIQ